MFVAFYTTYGGSNDPSAHPAYVIEVADLVEFITRSWCFKPRFEMTFFLYIIAEIGFIIIHAVTRWNIFQSIPEVIKKVINNFRGNRRT